MRFFERFLPEHERVERHWRRAEEALEIRDYEQVRREARELEKLKHSSWFELDARALAGLERNDEAVALLERAVAKLPEVGRLWEQLGIQRSDMERWDRAHAAFERARTCGNVPDLAATWLNNGIVWQRQGDPARAEQAFANAPATQDRDVASDLESLRAKCELELGRPTDALERVERWLASPDAKDESIDSRTRACIHATHARTLRAIGGPSARVQSAIDAALAANNRIPETAALLRELEGRCSPAAHRWRLTLRGHWPRCMQRRIAWLIPIRAKDMDFLVVYFVIAESPEDALRYCSPFEPPVTRASLSISNVEACGEAPGELLGVEKRSGYIFYGVRRWWSFGSRP